MRPRSGQRSQVLAKTPTQPNNLKHKLKHKLHSPPSHVPFTNSALIKKRTKPLTKAYDCLSMGIGRGCLVGVCVVWAQLVCYYLDCACCVYHKKGRGSHVQLCPRPCSSTHRRARLSDCLPKLQKKKRVAVRV